jgi:lipase chaperone LimK
MSHSVLVVGGLKADAPAVLERGTQLIRQSAQRRAHAHAVTCLHQYCDYLAMLMRG